MFALGIVTSNYGMEVQQSMTSAGAESKIPAKITTYFEDVKAALSKINKKRTTFGFDEEVTRNTQAFEQGVLKNIGICLAWAKSEVIDSQIMKQALAMYIASLKDSGPYWGRYEMESRYDGLLHQAVSSDNRDALEVLCIAQIAPLDSKDSYRRTPLHLAAQKGYNDVCKILLKYGAPVDAEDFFGETPLWDAARKGKSDVCITLLEAGADINPKNSYFGSVCPIIRIAQESKDEATIRVILEAIRCTRIK